MTSFIDDNGNILDYSGEDVGLTKEVASFPDFKIKGDVSVDFKLNNNSQNRKALGYYGAQQINSPAFSKVPFNMFIDGNKAAKGFIVIKTSDDFVIEAFFISGNANWFQSFEFNCKEIDFDDKFTVLADKLETIPKSLFTRPIVLHLSSGLIT